MSKSELPGCRVQGTVCGDAAVTELSRAFSSPHLRQEGFLIGVLDVLQIGRGDLHFMRLNKSTKNKWNI